jgi:type I restriction enzyme S subunit
MNQPYLVEAAEQAVPVGYKQTEVGVIPEGWSAYSLGQLSNFVTSGSRGWAKFYTNQGALFVRSQNVRNGKLDLKDSQFVTPKLGAEGDRTRLKLYDLLITITGNSVGNVALVEQDLGDAYISQHVGLVRLKNIEIANYICMFLSPHSIGNFQILASQSGQSKPGLTLKDLNEFLIVIPMSQEEQVAIVNALSDVDALLSELEKLIAKKQAIKTATMQQLLTGRTRLPQFSLREDGSSKGTKKSELGNIPEDWKIQGFGELFESSITRKSVKQSELVSFVGMQDVSENAQLTNQSEIQYRQVKSGFTYFEKGDVLVAKITPCFENGKGCHTEQLETDIGFGSTEFHVLRAKDSFDSVFIYFWTTRASLRVALEAEMVGSAGHRRVPFSALQNYQIPCSSDKNEQIAIANVLSDMDKEVQALEQRLNKTRQIKQGMMQELLTGKTRLVTPQVRG